MNKVIIIGNTNTGQDVLLQEAISKHGLEIAVCNEKLDFLDLLQTREARESIEIQTIHNDIKDLGLTNKEKNATIQPVRSEIKTGRNEPCPCGSGKKYKKCCLTK